MAFKKSSSRNHSFSKQPICQFFCNINTMVFLFESWKHEWRAPSSPLLQSKILYSYSSVVILRYRTFTHAFTTLVQMQIILSAVCERRAGHICMHSSRQTGSDLVLHIKVQSEYVQAHFQSGCWAINWIHGFISVSLYYRYGLLDCMCWGVSYIVWPCFGLWVKGFFSSSVWTSDVLSFIAILTLPLFLHYTCHFWPTNISTSLHLEAINHAIRPAQPFSPSEVFVSTGICVSRWLSGSMSGSALWWERPAQRVSEVNKRMIGWNRCQQRNKRVLSVCPPSAQRLGIFKSINLYLLTRVWIIGRC